LRDLDRGYRGHDKGKEYTMAGGKKGCLLIFVIVGVLVLLLYPSIKRTRSQLETLDEGIKVAWAQMERQHQQWLDLIPNYVETVKGYAPHEQEVFGAVTQAHAMAAVAVTMSQKIKANNELIAALDQLLVVAEQYPDLKADQQFIHLQEELADAEDSMAEGRMRYNEAVREYNDYIQGFPTVIVAAMFGFTKASLLEELEPSQVRF
jgi:LemA protein